IRARFGSSAVAQGSAAFAPLGERLHAADLDGHLFVERAALRENARWKVGLSARAADAKGLPADEQNRRFAGFGWDEAQAFRRLGDAEQPAGNAPGARVNGEVARAQPALPE